MQLAQTFSHYKHLLAVSWVLMIFTSGTHSIMIFTCPQGISPHTLSHSCPQFQDIPMQAPFKESAIVRQLIVGNAQHTPTLTHPLNTPLSRLIGNIHPQHWPY